MVKEDTQCCQSILVVEDDEDIRNAIAICWKTKARLVLSKNQ
jgi:hypothetical protein